ncbi:MAG: hypothetical protein JW751_10880, partial [Polyangiaceae bacterium]|nr:hypothetical protein [Polyangiaceae bacterium]
MKRRETQRVFVIANHSCRELSVGAGTPTETWDGERRLARERHLAWERICRTDRATIGHGDLGLDRTMLVVRKGLRRERRVRQRVFDAKASPSLCDPPGDEADHPDLSVLRSGLRGEGGSGGGQPSLGRHRHRAWGASITVPSSATADRANRGFADPMAFLDGRTEDGKRPWLGLRRRRGGFGGGEGVSAVVVGRAALQQRLCLGRAP